MIKVIGYSEYRLGYDLVFSGSCINNDIINFKILLYDYYLHNGYTKYISLAVSSSDPSNLTHAFSWFDQTLRNHAERFEGPRLTTRNSCYSEVMKFINKQLYIDINEWSQALVAFYSFLPRIYKEFVDAITVLECNKDIYYGFLNDIEKVVAQAARKDIEQTLYLSERLLATPSPNITDILEFMENIDTLRWRLQSYIKEKGKYSEFIQRQILSKLDDINTRLSKLTKELLKDIKSKLGS